MFFLRYILVHGPTAVFLERSFILVGLLFVLLSITFLIFFVKNKDFRFKRNFEFPKLIFVDLYEAYAMPPSTAIVIPTR